MRSRWSPKRSDGRCTSRPTGRVATRVSSRWRTRTGSWSTFDGSGPGTGRPTSTARTHGSASRSPPSSGHGPRRRKRGSVTASTAPRRCSKWCACTNPMSESAERPTPTILHVDMDAFYASVEVLVDPSLAGKAVIVGGDSERGVVASCSYEARAYGVPSAMPSVPGKRMCPHAVFVPGHYDLYSEYSRRLHEIFETA